MTAQRSITFSKPLKPFFHTLKNPLAFLFGKRQFCQWVGVKEESQESHIRDQSDMLNTDITKIQGFTHRDFYHPFAFPLLDELSYTSTNPSPVLFTVINNGLFPSPVFLTLFTATRTSKTEK